MLTSPQAISSEAKQGWATPQWLYDALRARFTFVLDAAADAENTKCIMFYDEKANGLMRPWLDATFCNPPWGDIGPWVTKAGFEANRGVRSVLLLPQLGLTTSWYKAARARCVTEILSPRIAYVGPGSAPSGGSMLLLFGQSMHVGEIRFWDVSDLRPQRRLL